MKMEAQGKTAGSGRKRGSYKSPAQRERVVRGWQMGKSKEEIAREEHINPKTVNHILLLEIPKEKQEAELEKAKAMLYGGLVMAVQAYFKAMMAPEDKGHKAGDFLERMKVLPGLVSAQTIDVTHQEKPTTFEQEVDAYAVRALKNAAMRAALHGEGLPTPRPEPDTPLLEAEVVDKKLKLSEVLKLDGDE